MLIQIYSRTDFYKIYDFIYRNYPEKSVLVKIEKSMSFIEPIDVLILAKFLILCIKNNISINLDAHEAVMQYFISIGLENFCKKNFEQPQTINFIQSLHAMPIRRVERENMDEYIGLTHQYLESLFPRKDLNMLKICLAELINNVYDHSHSEIGAYVFCQYYKKNNVVKIAVGDFGIGIPVSVNTYFLRKGEQRKSSIDCLKWAIKENKTVASLPYNMGKGLNNINTFVKSNKGKWMVYTDKAKLIGYGAGNNFSKNDVYNFKGTVIQIEIKIDNLEENDPTYVDFDW